MLGITDEYMGEHIKSSYLRKESRRNELASQGIKALDIYRILEKEGYTNFGLSKRLPQPCIKTLVKLAAYLYDGRPQAHIDMQLREDY